MSGGKKGRRGINGEEGFGGAGIIINYARGEGGLLIL